MKNSILIALLMLSACYASAQTESNRDDDDDHHYHGSRTHNHFDIDLGMNNFLEDGKNPSGAPYEVKPWGSWYLALKSINTTHIKGKFNLLWGADVSFNAFKFQDKSVRLEKTDDELLFLTDDITGAHKSKLDVVYINLSAVPMFQFGGRHQHHHWGYDGDVAFGSQSGGFRIGLGAYGGYRIGSKAKYVVKDDGKDKEKDHDNFYLNNWRYGVRLQTGFRGVDFFINYDLNELFVEGKGPELNAFSFGLVL